MKKVVANRKRFVLGLTVAVAAAWISSCTGTDRFPGLGTEFGRGGSGGEDGGEAGVTDGGVDGTREDGGGTEPDGDTPSGPTTCRAEGQFCENDQVRECNGDGTGTVLIRDCTVDPYTGCALGLCRPGSTETNPGPCCVSGGSFCDAQVGVAGYDPNPAMIEFDGVWDESGYGCSGVTLAESEFVFSVSSYAIACESGFIQVNIHGGLEDVQPFGTPIDICSAGVSVKVDITEHEAGGGSVAVTYNEICDPPNGTITITEWGAAPNQPFGIEVEATLNSDTTDREVDFSLSADGTLVVGRN